jgi:hypothetical protein
VADEVSGPRGVQADPAASGTSCRSRRSSRRRRGDVASPDPGARGTAELREQLAQIRGLPTSQQRFLWAAGRPTQLPGDRRAAPGLTRRTVERQILQRGEQAAGAYESDHESVEMDEEQLSSPPLDGVLLAGRANAS